MNKLSYLIILVGLTACVKKTPAPVVKAIEAGPIWNQADANTKCTALAKENNARWTGQWWTTVPNEMSVCALEFR